jgi:hypothetical protein
VRNRAIRTGRAFIGLVQTAILCAFILIIGGQLALADAAAPTAEDVEFFETHIRPVLAQLCYECHSEKAKLLQGGLRLDTAARMRAGGDSGPAIVPNNPADSLLLAALRYESYEMPPSGKLPDDVIANFEKWISLGAPDPRVEDTAPSGKNPDGPPQSGQHWAFQRPQRSAPPSIQNKASVRSDLDRFVVARVEAAGLTPSPQAPPRVLLRRLYFDLVGLPPTVAELAEFEADPSDSRYEAAADRLLASPRFGERWARHWLDIARYSDTKGYVFQEDRSYKGAYKYRDWVIASFNSDLPFDRFVVAQLAADQVDDAACAPAAGFLTLGRRFLKNQHEIINDRIDVMTRGIMGLTVGCARCHDHKYDPISAADYYALYGVFASSEEQEREDLPPQLVDAAKPVEPVVFLRGNPGSPGPKVDRRFLTILTHDGQPKPFQRGSGRKEMAEAIASRDNPLTARVWVNRVWGHLFGTPPVATTSDFGVRGTPPTNPELLDWMACELMDDGWSTKRLIRKIVLSNTYRQSSESRPECFAVDAANLLQWRANRRRLDLETLRDSLLVAAGRLDETMGGPSVPLTDAPFATRRSVYGFIERQNLPAFFRTFDFANPNTHTPERPLTTSPQQALFLMNSPFAIEQSIYLAGRTAIEELAGVEPPLPKGDGSNTPANRVRRINRLYQFALRRDAAVEELADALEFVDRPEPTDYAQIRNQLAWQYGWGTFDEANAKIQFEPMPFYSADAWQGGSSLPDGALGWAMLNSTGGHPGDAAHMVIRRWVAPANGTLHIEGVLSHASQQGDGVRGRIFTSRGGLLGSWDAFHSEASTAPTALTVEAGDTVDFISDCRAAVDHDSFGWTVTLRLTPADGQPEQVWDSVSGFHGPLQPPLSRWEELAQVLLMSNEFMFVD